MTDEDNPQKSPAIVTLESATSSVENLYEEGVLDPVYYAKTLVLNRALQEIGMGKYQVNIFLTFFFLRTRYVLTS